MSFHNTIDIAGKSLKEATKKVKQQNAVIMQYFMKHPHAMPTPWQILDWLKANGTEMLITSVRRSLTDLADEGKLRKSEVQFIGPQGKPNHAWMLNIKAKKQKVQGTGNKVQEKTKRKTQKTKTNAKAKVVSGEVHVKAHTRKLKAATPNPSFHQQTLSI